ncbi:MAG: hypothetical protein MUF54_15950 [Polyangiaceae bacterium]|nr:hypothetical protein [Polyangiaceae bacterium]
MACGHKMWSVVLTRLGDPLASMFDFEPCTDLVARREELMAQDRQARQRRRRARKDQDDTDES